MNNNNIVSIVECEKCCEKIVYTTEEEKDVQQIQHANETGHVMCWKVVHLKYNKIRRNE